MSSISLSHVYKSYGNESVVEDMNLEIRDGSFTVLVGASGCGKSTTLRMITGLESVTKGDIFIDGQRVNDLAPGKRHIPPGLSDLPFLIRRFADLLQSEICRHWKLRKAL